MHHPRNDLVAQLDSALDFESNGCGFESRQGYGYSIVFFFLFCCIVLCSQQVGGSNPSALSSFSTLDSMITSTWVRSSVVEHGIADPMVAGSIPVTPFV